MSWERRLRELILAGGALSACSSQTPVAYVGNGSGVASGGDEASSSGTTSSVSGTPQGPFPCNLNPDPCCSDPTGPSCLCEREGGVWSPDQSACQPRATETDAEAGPPEAASEASPDVSSPSDVSSPPDAESYDDPAAPPLFCCNLNPDPCCPQKHCGAPATPECAMISSDASTDASHE
jgi:hypothetical protein